MKYVVDCYRQSHLRSPKLIAVRDTHARPNLPLRYREDHKEIEQAVSTYLAGIGSDVTFATIVFGHEVDRQYVKMIQATMGNHTDKLKCFQLTNSGPMMNFIIMDYDDYTSEVLFGWGQGKPGWPGAVFRSKDPRLVEEFGNFYEVLLQASRPISVELLLKQ